MPAKESEAIALRSYPFDEADLIVVVFTRADGKLRGIAKRARRPSGKRRVNRFGPALERLAVSHLNYFVPKQFSSLVKLDRAELIGGADLWKADYATAVVLDVIAELTDMLVPERVSDDSYPRDNDDAIFRLVRLVVEEACRSIGSGGRERPLPIGAHRCLVYFLIWMMRLEGLLPPLDRCIRTQRAFGPDEASCYSDQSIGLLHHSLADSDTWMLPPESRSLAERMLGQRLDALEDVPWSQPEAAALQHFLLEQVRMHAGRPKSLDALESLYTDPEQSTAGGRER